MTLGEARAFLVRHQRAVKERRRCQIQGAVEEDLASGGDEEIRAANNFGDAHGGVIYNAGELIGG